MKRDVSELQWKLGWIAILAILNIAIFTFLVPLPDAMGAESTAKEIMTQVWAEQYPESLRNEVISGKETDGEQRDFGAWVDFSPGWIDSKAEIFIGTYSDTKGAYIGRTGGTLFVLAKNSFGYRVYVSRETGRRANVKEKVGSFDALANSTQMNYFDIVRNLLPENPAEFEFSFVDRQPNAVYSIKAVPVSPAEGDYAHRIFHLKKMEDGRLVAFEVDHFNETGYSVKTIKNGEWRKSSEGVWRPYKIEVVSADGSKTTLDIVYRSFNIQLGNLSERDLKEGRPAR